MREFDLIVIGAGPGGYVAAIRAAKLGLNVAVVEKNRAGGTCLNRGCIPAKAMLHAAEEYRNAKESGRFGIHVGDVAFDYGEILRYKEETTDRLVQGVEQLFSANGVTVIRGRGVLQADGLVRIETDEAPEGAETDEVVRGKDILLATGSKPSILPIPGMDLPGVLTSDDLFRLKELPKSLTIIGGGVISVEFATIFSGLGSKVTILEAAPRLLPNMDKEIGQSLKLTLKKRGVDIYTSASVLGVHPSDGGYTCTFSVKEKEQETASEYVLCAVGRIPETDGLFDAGAAPEMERGRILVDERFATSIPHVYAIGDAVPGIQLAHVASAQGMCAAELLAGGVPSIDRDAVPSCVYTDPEIASVGLTEEQAKAAGVAVKTGKFIMSANGKSVITQEERGFIKILTDETTGAIVGAQLMCARATDMVGELVTAVANGLTAQQLLKGMRAHPTYNEGIGEALEELFGGAIHTAPRKKR